MTAHRIPFVVVSLSLAVVGAGPAQAQQPKALFGAPCTSSADSPVTEASTGRTYLLDYPCDLRAGEDVTVVLSLHGGGSNQNWQRRYFPAFDQKERHRLVIAVPFSPIRRWTEDDDAYLQNIVMSIVSEVGDENVRAFWLAGHSQGGATSRRLVCTPFFASRVDGFLSLSGGRLGGAPARAADAGRPPQVGEPAAAAAAPAAAAAATPAGDPGCDFSHIFEIGEHEIASLPTTSTWAGRYGCDARAQRPDVVDTRPGYVHDGSRQNPGSRAWGLLPRSGSARVFVYPGCEGGRVVADVMRLDKGHTEGLEPAVTEALVALMVSAPGGKIARAAASTSSAQAAQQAVTPVDYADGAAWLCRPARADACAVDLTTTVVRADGTQSREEWRADPNAPIDCFYVYPTVSTDPGMNSDMTPNEAELRVVYQQFARFGSVCRLYAPSYRQVTLAGLRERRSGGATNLNQGLAYDDVRDAFRYYLEHDNAGRGFVLIGHSQGSYVLTSLVAQEIEGKPAQDRMVSALLTGATVTVARGADSGGAFRTVPLCRSPTQTQRRAARLSLRTGLHHRERARRRASLVLVRPRGRDPVRLRARPAHRALRHERARDLSRDRRPRRSGGSPRGRHPRRPDAPMGPPSGRYEPRHGKPGRPRPLASRELARPQMTSTAAGAAGISPPTARSGSREGTRSGQVVDRLLPLVDHERDALVLRLVEHAAEDLAQLARLTR
jgi:hypothetical protein